MPYFLFSANYNHQEFVWDPREPEERAGDGAIANHRQPFSEFNFLTIKLRSHSSSQVADQDCHLDARGSRRWGDYFGGGDSGFRQDQGELCFYIMNISNMYLFACFYIMNISNMYLFACKSCPLPGEGALGGNERRCWLAEVCWCLAPLCPCHH